MLTPDVDAHMLPSERDTTSTCGKFGSRKMYLRAKNPLIRPLLPTSY